MRRAALLYPLPYVERVGYLRLLSCHQRSGKGTKVRGGSGGKAGRQSSVAVIEADNTIAACRQRLPETFRPADHLRTEAGYQEHRRLKFIAEAVIGQFRCRWP